jgi:hypothetical protein
VQHSFVVNFALVIGGVYCLLMALFHGWAWKRLGLSRDLSYAMPQTRILAQFLNWSMIYFLGVFGATAVLLSQEVSSTRIGRLALLYMALFWYARATLQVVYFGVRSPKLAGWAAWFALGGILFTISLL